MHRVYLSFFLKCSFCFWHKLASAKHEKSQDAGSDNKGGKVVQVYYSEFIAHASFQIFWECNCKHISRVMHLEASIKIYLPQKTLCRGLVVKLSGFRVLTQNFKTQAEVFCCIEAVVCIVCISIEEDI